MVFRASSGSLCTGVYGTLCLLNCLLNLDIVTDIFSLCGTVGLDVGMIIITLCFSLNLSSAVGLDGGKLTIPPCLFCSLCGVIEPDGGVLANIILCSLPTDVCLDTEVQSIGVLCSACPELWGWIVE